MEIIISIYNQPYVKYLVALIVANLALGILTSLRNNDFKLTRLADWLWSRVIPLLVGYGVAAFLAYSNPELGWLKDAAFGTLTLTLLGYILSNLRDFGINLPDQVAGKAGNESQ